MSLGHITSTALQRWPKKLSQVARIPHLVAQFTQPTLGRHFFTIPVYVINIPPVGGHLPKARADRHEEHLKVPVRLQPRTTPLRRRRQGLGQRDRVLLAVPERLPGIVGFRGERGHVPETGGEERVRFLQRWRAIIPTNICPRDE